MLVIVVDVNAVVDDRHKPFEVFHWLTLLDNCDGSGSNLLISHFI